MGGEFFFKQKPGFVLDEQEWQLALQLAVAIMLQKKPWQDGFSAAPTMSTDMDDEYAFEFEDTVKWSHGDPKSFRLRWVWSDKAIESNLGGRHRTDWSSVRLVCEIICKLIPGKFALVVCDGFGGYGEEDIYFDGLGSGYHKLDWSYWPWSKAPNPKAESIPKNAMTKEQMIHALVRTGIRFH
jgi:hypothetical protein